jgi:hypothetical protein
VKIQKYFVGLSLGLSLGLALCLLIGLFCAEQAMAIEEPKFDVVLSEGPFEVRHYAPMLVAEAFVEGDMDEASNKGFRLIADFIFGNNQAPESTTPAKVAMTAPVTVEPQSGQSGGPNMKASTQWRVNFVMPSQYTLASIPKPKNNAVGLRELPSKYFVVLKYSGLNTLAKVQVKTQETTAWALKKNLTLIGSPQLSRYDPPWTLPLFRRNEIMIEVAAPKP